MGARSEQESRLLRLINELAVQRGRVTLASGAEADYYLDLRRITLHHLGAPLVGEAMLAHLVNLGYHPAGSEPAGLGDSRVFDAVGGLTLGADPVATAILHAAHQRGAGVDSFVVRKAAKAHGMQRQIEGPDVSGRRVIVVEDTTTTGSSPLAALEAVRAAGGEVLVVATIVDRDTGARAAIEARGVPYHPLFGVADLEI